LIIVMLASPARSLHDNSLSSSIHVPCFLFPPFSLLFLPLSPRLSLLRIFLSRRRKKKKKTHKNLSFCLSLSHYRSRFRSLSLSHCLCVSVSLELLSVFACLGRTSPARVEVAKASTVVNNAARKSTPIRRPSYTRYY
jgi:hypothetical protein